MSRNSRKTNPSQSVSLPRGMEGSAVGGDAGKPSEDRSALTAAGTTEVGAPELAAPGKDANGGEMPIAAGARQPSDINLSEAQQRAADAAGVEDTVPRQPERELQAKEGTVEAGRRSVVAVGCEGMTGYRQGGEAVLGSEGNTL